MRRSIRLIPTSNILLATSLVTALLFACDGAMDCEDCCDDCPPPDNNTLTVKDLTQKWHVLNNIEYAYKMRDVDVYDELLNADFAFYFFPGDVGGGIPASWTRVEESDATARLFLSNQQESVPPPDPVCRAMRLDIVFEKESIQWTEVQPSVYPAEKWYTTDAFYTFTFEIEPNTTYIAVNGAKARFTIRNNAATNHWELVELRDLAGSSIPPRAVGTQEATWGAIKGLYSPSS